MSQSVIFTDPVLHQLHQRVVSELGEIAVYQPVDPDLYFERLAESIMGQQLSEKVAPIIVARVKQAVGEFTPEQALATSVETLRAAGLSNAKASYIHNIARAWVDKEVIPEQLTELPETEVMDRLTQIKGVGQWTAEMFLMFTLGRTDVFSIGDYGLKRAILKAYNLPMTTKPAELLALSQQWQPNRTLACRILWRSLELPTES